MTHESSTSEVAADEIDERAYRLGVGLMVFNRQGQVFAGNRIDYPGEHWQMPQGGIDPGETPREAAMRELKEEIGTNKAKIIAESRDWYSYRLPMQISHKAWGGRYRGQSLRWFAMRFTGTDQDIRLDSHVPEFCAWRWIEFDKLPTIIVPFKRTMYGLLVNEFSAIARTNTKNSDK